MKRITISMAALALMLVAADTASAQTRVIVGGGGYRPGYVVRPAPVIVAPRPVYVQPGYSVFYNTNRFSIGYSSGWSSFYNYGYPTYRYNSFYSTPYVPRSYYGWYR